MKSLETKIIFRILLLSLMLFVLMYLIEKQKFTFAIFPFCLVVYQTYNLIQFLNKSSKDLAQFVLSVKYRDFSQHFNENESNKHLREAFNEINKTFKEINFEKESQYQYLIKTLDLVNTGILSFNSSGEVKWMNESLKKMLGIPYLKTIHLLETRFNELYRQIIDLKPGEIKLFEIKGKEIRKVVLSNTSFNIDGDQFTIIAFQNVNQVIEETESHAWQKLLGVLTHEIMNSISPIASLADTLTKRINENAAPESDSELNKDVQSGIQVIKSRSENLLKFAETYRHLYKVAQLNLSIISVRSIFENLEILLEPKFLQKNIQFSIHLKEPDYKIKADLSLIEQILLNLIFNSIDAFKDTNTDRVLKLSAYHNEDKRIFIDVIDNADGISPEILDKIFIPFFTTKKTGNGIGLSLSKQIMQLHNGQLSVLSEVGKGSIFRLQFP